MGPSHEGVPDAGTPPARVRVTAPSMAAAHDALAASAHHELPGTPGAGGTGGTGDTGGADDLFVRSLIRSQLRLAVTCALGFCALLATFAVAIGLLPQLDELRLFGVPSSWLLLAFGVYPLVLVTAMIYVRAARRNEAGYLALTEDE